MTAAERERLELQPFGLPEAVRDLAAAGALSEAARLRLVDAARLDAQRFEHLARYTTGPHARGALIIEADRAAACADRLSVSDLANGANGTHPESATMTAAATYPVTRPPAWWRRAFTAEAGYLPPPLWPRADRRCPDGGPHSWTREAATGHPRDPAGREHRATCRRCGLRRLRRAGGSGVDGAGPGTHYLPPVAAL